jgi:predicted nucleotidyltransferase
MTDPNLDRDTILRTLREHRSELEDLGVSRLALFGSAVRNDLGPRSDIDILVDFSRPVGFFAFFEVKERLECLLGAQVDLVVRSALKRQLRDRILAEAIDAA